MQKGSRFTAASGVAATRSQKDTARTGFTLIEILIVIAIIGLLSTILYPVFSTVRESARRTGCMSNLKQIGLGLLQYSQDYDETAVLPFYSSSQTISGGSTYYYEPVGASATGVPAADGKANYTWMDALYPYTRNAQIYNCPSETKGTNQDYNYPLSGNNWGSYLMCGQYWNKPSGSFCTDTPCSMAFVGPISKISNPAQTIWIMEGGNPNAGIPNYVLMSPNGIEDFNPIFYPNGLGNLSVPLLNSSNSLAGWGQEGTVLARHLGTTNVLYADGHVKAVSIQNQILNSTRTSPNWWENCQQAVSPYSGQGCYTALTAF